MKASNKTILILSIIAFLSLLVIIAFVVFPQIIFPKQGEIACSPIEGKVGEFSCSRFSGGGEPSPGNQFTSGGTVTLVVENWFSLFVRNFDANLKPILVRDNTLASEFFSENTFCRSDPRAIYNSVGVGCSIWEQCPQFEAYEAQFRGAPLYLDHMEVNSGCSGIFSQYDPTTPIAFIISPQRIVNENLQHQLMIVEGVVDSFEGEAITANETFKTYAFCDFGDQGSKCVVQEPNVSISARADCGDCGWRGTINKMTLYVKMGGHTQEDICTIGEICSNIPDEQPADDEEIPFIEVVVTAAIVLLVCVIVIVGILMWKNRRR